MAKRCPSVSLNSRTSCRTTASRSFRKSTRANWRGCDCGLAKSFYLTTEFAEHTEVVFRTGAPTVCNDSDLCTNDTCDATLGCLFEVGVESPECESCADGIDNDGDGIIDAENPNCSTLYQLQRTEQPGPRISLDSSLERELGLDSLARASGSSAELRPT